ncbi:diaminopimelate epimerase [Rickettsiales bacterium LUAb2]
MITNFYKMHALGNDFVIIDTTKDKLSLTTEKIKFLCHRRFGIGCDQLILTEEIKPLELVKMSIFNQDGSSASACGNATRCVGLLYMQKYQTKEITIKTDNRTLLIKLNNNNIIANMGKASFNNEDIPLSNSNLNSLDLKFTDLELAESGMAVNVGNPHVVFVVQNVDNINLAEIGPKLENHHFFPNKTNVEFIQILSPNLIKMRVWERGSGITLACGTGATASFAAASQLNLINKQEPTKIILDGGELLLSYDNNSNIIIEGAANLVFEGKIDL